MTVIDFAERTEVLKPWLAKGVRFIKERVLPGNLASLLAAHVSRGGLIVDLTWSIEFFDILEWVRNADVFYANHCTGATRESSIYSRNGGAAVRR